MIESFSAARGRSTIAGDSAENLGRVKDLIVSLDAKRVDRLHLAGGRKSAKWLNWSSIRSFGPDAVVTEGPVPDQEPSGRNDRAIVGSRVLTTMGVAIGNVTDVQFETDDGLIVSVLSDAGPIEASRLRALGSYALIVSPEKS